MLSLTRYFSEYLMWATSVADGPLARNSKAMDVSRELAEETWDEYFDAVGRELVDAPVSVERPGHRNPSTELSLRSLRYDAIGETLRLALVPVGSASGGVEHLIVHPRRVAINTQTMLAPLTISVETQDGGRTVIHFERETERSEVR
jgi:hypothetical protein